MQTLVDSQIEWLAEIHKALGDVARLRILQLLPRNTSDADALFSVSELAAEMGMPQPTVSHHLKILRQAGIIRFAKRRNIVYYYLDAKRLRQVWRELNQNVLRQ